MASWLNLCSSARLALKPSSATTAPRSRWHPLLWLALASTGCGQAQTPESEAASAPVEPAISAALTDVAPKASASAGSAASTATDTSAQPTNSATQALCKPAPAGWLRARLQGAIDAEIDWQAGSYPQCLGVPRPTGDGIRLLYKGSVAGDPVVIVIGVSTLTRAGSAVRNVPANLTLIREGTGVFYATQGDDKCAFDSVQQVPLPEEPDRFRLTGRGYCTQPARALGADGAVLVSRFDVEAIIEYPSGQPE
jgi:hypothetical protein